MRFLSVFLTSLILLQFTACAPHVAGLRHDESFNYDSVVNGGIAIAGVSATFTEFPDGQKNQLAEIFRRAIIDKREGYRVLPAGLLEQRMGDGYSVMLDNFHDGAVISPEDIALLQQKQIPARYLLLSRIENHAVRENRNNTPVYDDNDKATDRVTVTLQTIADITAFSSIYDLQKGVSVWSGSITQNITKENSFETYAGSSYKKHWKMQLQLYYSAVS